MSKYQIHIGANGGRHHDMYHTDYYLKVVGMVDMADLLDTPRVVYAGTDLVFDELINAQFAQTAAVAQAAYLVDQAVSS